MPKPALNTREKIVEAAAHLFYSEGIRAVSVDAVAAKSQLTKKTLYYHFASKDELIAAYLASRDQPTLQLYQKWFDETEGTVCDKVRGMFQRFAQVANSPEWRGCGFNRTAAELASTPGHPAVKAGATHKKRFEGWLTDIFERESISNARTSARQIIVLLDGAASIMLIHRDPAYVEAAGEVAANCIRT